MKVLVGEDLPSVRLSSHQAMPHDRLPAISVFKADRITKRVVDPTKFLKIRSPAFMPCLMALTTRYEDKHDLLRLTSRDGRSTLGFINRPAPHEAINRFLREYVPLVPTSDLVVRIHSYKRDCRTLSLINLATVRELGERMAKKAIDPRRFRGNIYVDAIPPWQEMTWNEIAIGGARLRIVEPTVRCDVTSYNVDTGARDMNIVRMLKDGYGHINLGVYATVVEGSPIAPGDELRVISTH